MPAGRPLIYSSVEELEPLIEDYFESVRYESEEGKVSYRPGMAGLAYALGIDRKTLTNYSHKEEFFPAIKRARDRVEVALEANLYNNSVTGTIFNLKNNFDWKDKTETDNTTHVKMEEVTRPKLTKEEWLKTHEVG